MSVSVLMTVRDGEKYVGEAIASLLEQTVRPTQILVVDDGSTDATAGIVAAFGDPVTLLSQPPSGIAPAWNRALAHANGDFIAFLDYDDLWPPNSLEVRLDRFATAGEVDAVAGKMEQFLSPELDATARPELRFVDTVMPGELMTMSLFDAQRMRRFGLLDETIPTAVTGADWMARARHEGLVTATVDEVVLRRRIHDTNTSRVARGTPNAAMLEIARRQHRRRKES